MNIDAELFSRMDPKREEEEIHFICQKHLYPFLCLRSEYMEIFSADASNDDSLRDNLETDDRTSLNVSSYDFET